MPRATFAAGAGLTRKSSLNSKQGTSFAGLRPGLGRAGITKSMRLVGPGGGLNKKTVFYMNQVGGIGRGHSRKCGGPPCNVLRYSQPTKVEEVDVDSDVDSVHDTDVDTVHDTDVDSVPDSDVDSVPDSDVHSDHDGYSDDLKQDLHTLIFHKLRKHLPEEDFDNDKISNFIHEILELDMDNICIAVDTYNKELHHSLTSACECTDACNLPNIVHETNDKIIHAEGYKFSICITEIISHSLLTTDLTLSINFLVEEPIDLDGDGEGTIDEQLQFEEMLLRVLNILYDFDANHVELELRQAVGYISDEKKSGAILAHRTTKKLHHIHTDKSPSACNNNCLNKYAVHYDKYIGEALHDGNSVNTSCVVLSISDDLSLYLHLYEPEEYETFRDSDINQDGLLDANETEKMYTDAEFDILDKNDDGKIDLGEHRDRDLDNNGTLTSAEILASSNEEDLKLLLIEKLGDVMHVKNCVAKYYIENMLHISDMQTILNELQIVKNKMKNKESIGNHLIRTYNAENKEEVQLHFTHSDNDVITIVLCLHIATPTTLKNKLNRHNHCIKEEIQHLIDNKINHLDSDEIATFLVNCIYPEDNACMYMGDVENLHMNLHVSTHKRDEYKCHSCSACCAFTDVQLDDEMDGAMDDKFKCGMEYLIGKTLMFYLYNDHHHLLVIECDADSTSCEHKSIFKEDLPNMLAELYPNFDSNEIKELYQTVMDKNLDVINNYNSSQNCKASIDLNTMEITLIKVTDNECHNRSTVHPPCDLLDDENYLENLNNKLILYNDLEGITYLHTMQYSDMLYFSVALTDSHVNTITSNEMLMNTRDHNNLYYTTHLQDDNHDTLTVKDLHPVSI